MFRGYFQEAQEQTVDLEEMQGVISKLSLEALFQWLYLRFVKFDIEDPGEHISAAIELARLADKYEITGIESQTAQYIKEIIIANPKPSKTKSLVPYNSNTHYLGSEDIISGILLHDKHPVRRVLAAASVKGFLQSASHDYAATAQEYPEFGADLLHEGRLALNTLNPHRSVNFQDPITGTRWYLL